MEEFKLFNANEFEGKNAAQAQQFSAIIKQRFDQKRARIHQFRTQYPLNEHWNELNGKIVEFDNAIFNPWNQKWAQINRSNNIAQFTAYFNEGNKIFDEIEGFISSLPLPNQNNDDIEALKQDVLSRIENDFLSLKNSVNIQIDEGINKLVGLDAELGLEKNFKTNIENDLSKSNIHRYSFLAGFILTVLLIPSFLGATFLLDSITKLEYAELLLLRFGVTLSLTVLTYFFFSQYKLYQLISLRYSHLFGFLGGGATFINQLIGGNDESKESVNKRMAELFMELEMLNGQVKENQHPVEMTIDKAIEVVDKFTEVSKKLKG